ncbi:beta-galactosidase [Nitzschia inconspicua]|uniref:Beta-galactosidase n=1 Tax=Nitzschia inconspicua TaxID=303405 RepID=A0A9K3LBC3_9STRA|nr:beta-galactosidase [Nitzschia inconspicua]
MKMIIANRFSSLLYLLWIYNSSCSTIFLMYGVCAAQSDTSSVSRNMVGLSNSNALPSRLVIPFDFGWKHRTGLKDWAPSNDRPPKETDPGIHPPEAQPYFDDSEWWTVQLPHDGLIRNTPSKEACPDGCSGRSYIPRHVLWYRKQFQLPTDHDDNNVIMNHQYVLEFQGSFRNTTVWINGKLVKNHICGYTPFRVPLTPSMLELGQGKNTNNTTHAIAVFVDPDNGDDGGPSRGSGWWYEGGGLYRHVHLIRLHKQVHVSLTEGLFVKSTTCMTHSEHNRLSCEKVGETNNVTTRAILDMEATIEIDGEENVLQNYCFQFLVHDGEGHDAELVATSPLQFIDIIFNADSEFKLRRGLRNGEPAVPKTITVSHSIVLENAKLWTSRSPHLYRVDIAVYQNCNPGEDERRQFNKQEVDRVTTYHGIRSLRFDANHGFFFNEQPFKLRGFCDHDTFAVVGMALPDRINLFRAQASRSIGANARRTSHNPPDPALLDMYDRLGMVVMDENRLFANNPDYVQNMQDLVLRDRNHPSVIIWSFCNENGCEGDHEAGGPAFQNVTDTFDGTRPTLANMFSFNDLLSNTVTIQGFSHQSREKLDECHATLPRKPILMSECCSCNTMRGEDEGCETIKDNPHYTCDQKAFNGRCLENLVNASDGAEYSSGTFVWTLFDYYGEPPSAGLTVSSSYGQYDLCGFPKAAASWFRTQWLLEDPDDESGRNRADKPFPVDNLNEVYIVESWESPDNWNVTKGNKTRTIHAYSNAPNVEIFLNDESQGVQEVSRMTSNPGTYTEFEIPWHAGSLKAVARSKNGTAVAQTSKFTNGKPGALLLSLDCPSLSTGTGEALFLDGQDVALVRATIVDAVGQTVHISTHNITFQILSGPGRIVGTANGDSKSYQPHTSSWQMAYHGLVRAVVQVTSMASVQSKLLDLMTSIDRPSTELSEYPSMYDSGDIILEATTPGLPKAVLRIPTSTDPKDTVLSVAAAGAGLPVDFFQQSVMIDGGKSKW